MNKTRVQPFAAERRIVEKVIREAVPIGQQNEQLQPEHLVRQANQYRQNGPPRNPEDLDFEIIEDDIPQKFLKADIEING